MKAAIGPLCRLANGPFLTPLFATSVSNDRLDLVCAVIVRQSSSARSVPSVALLCLPDLGIGFLAWYFARLTFFLRYGSLRTRVAHDGKYLQR